jgi:hypothetical protein
MPQHGCDAWQIWCCKQRLATISDATTKFSVSFSPPTDFHPAFEAMAEISPNPFAASWTAPLFNQAVLADCLP